MINILDITKLPGLDGFKTPAPASNGGQQAPADFEAMVELAAPPVTPALDGGAISASGKDLPETTGSNLPDLPVGEENQQAAAPILLVNERAPPAIPGAASIRESELSSLPHIGAVRLLVQPESEAISPPEAVNDGLAKQSAQVAAGEAEPMARLVNRLANILVRDPQAQDIQRGAGAAELRADTVNGARADVTALPLANASAAMTGTLRDLWRQIQQLSAAPDKVTVKFNLGDGASQAQVPIAAMNGVPEGLSAAVAVPASPVPAAPLLAAHGLQTSQASQTAPHAFETLVDRLVEARDTARPGRAEMAMPHDEFGRVTLRVDTGPLTGPLRMSLSSPDPDFAPAAQAALADRAAHDGDRAQPDQSRPDQSRPDQNRNDLAQRQLSDNARGETPGQMHDSDDARKEQHKSQGSSSAHDLSADDSGGPSAATGSGRTIFA